jgi:hypothetical protein
MLELRIFDGVLKESSANLYKLWQGSFHFGGKPEAVVFE